jgi:FimV-like protein
MGKKMSVIMLMTLLAAPLLAVGADNKDPANDQPAVSAVNQQQDVNEDSVVTSAATPKAVEPVSAPALPQELPANAAATATASESATPVKSAEGAGLTAKKMEMFSQKIIDLSDKINQLQQQADQFRQQIRQLQYTVYGLAALVVLLALLSMARRPKKSAKIKASYAPAKPAPDSGKTIKIEDDTAGEYDFMGSSEGIPAKLDLARAYIAMEDFTAARETLAEILGEGSEEHRQEARSLLKKINP